MIVTLLGWLACAEIQAQQPIDAVDAKKMDSLWAELASASDADSIRALLALAATPKETTRYISDRLKPVKVDAKQFETLVKQLDDEDFNRRESAANELTQLVKYLEKHARVPIELHLKGKPSAEVNRRLRELLGDIPSEKKPGPAVPPKLQGRSISVQSNNGDIIIIIDGKPLDLAALAKPVPLPAPNTQRIRAVRAILLLERIATPEAKAVLADMASGAGDASPTREAKAALERLGKVRE
jgi:hypothetical protein